MFFSCNHLNNPLICFFIQLIRIFLKNLVLLVLNVSKVFNSVIHCEGCINKNLLHSVWRFQSPKRLIWIKPWFRAYLNFSLKHLNIKRWLFVHNAFIAFQITFLSFSRIALRRASEFSDVGYFRTYVNILQLLSSQFYFSLFLRNIFFQLDLNTRGF